MAQRDVNVRSITESRFTAPGRDMAAEDRIVLTSVGVDIGSSTSHLLFSRLELERRDSRYEIVKREELHASDILFTPYRGPTEIDGQRLAAFVDEQYRAAGIRRADVDTGALILTGVALLRDNARAIGDVFAAEAGRFVAVSAGDNLEATMAAHGSGAIELSRTVDGVMHIDIGGGTTKVVICRDGHVSAMTALDIGARLLAWSADNVLIRMEEAGHRAAAAAGLQLRIGQRVVDVRRVARYMTDELVRALRGETPPLLRGTPLMNHGPIGAVTFSGGVSEFVYGRTHTTFGDLGSLIADEIRARDFGAPIVDCSGGIRATVIGASQYTIQLSGSTIFVSPLEALPVRNVPVIVPRFDWTNLSTDSVHTAVETAMRHFDRANGPVALAAHWQDSATFARIDAFARGALAALSQQHVPLILVFDTDVGGLVGLHIRDELHVDVPVISIDGVELREFDYIDIGELISSAGAVPVVIKSLVFGGREPYRE